jgi:hypothetical protein
MNIDNNLGFGYSNPQITKSSNNQYCSGKKIRAKNITSLSPHLKLLLVV